ncbi:MAG: phenylalanine--tRNA ligase alpha subunit, partial [Pseudomonadota bacterium]
MVELDQLVSEAVSAFEMCTDTASLENAKARFLGKSGSVTELLKGLSGLDPDARRAEGALVNKAKATIEAALVTRRQSLTEQALQARLSAEAIDVTLPGRGRGIGTVHPVIKTW